MASKMADSTQLLLMEYHDVFLLEPGKLGCTHSTKHVIKVADDTPFKEWFRQSLLPLIEEAHNHLNHLPYDPIRVHGISWLCWSERRMEAYASVLTSAILMPI